ncbi:MAG: DNA repair protein RadC [Candidatus Thiodiazotropha sp. (ex Lucinoma borealis)]|nr:DNA repair protein RadC [Candidatus Thiodiazotropha sp. (ex Lucinoma borealis)]MCU7866128.1 DNA repair protein RadC [Candidatus Thiodiazotropha sp. (ex Lucinoma borealis)]
MERNSNIVQLTLLKSNCFEGVSVTKLNSIEKDTLISLALSVMNNWYQRGETFTSPVGMREYLQLRFGALEHELFSIVLLDNRHRLICIEEMFRGTIDGATVFPREVVKIVLKHNAAAVVFVHNHPSGVAEPSTADQSITSRLKKALVLIDVRVLDHIIVSHETAVSFAEQGLL